VNRIPTPDTDALARGNHVVPTAFAEDLERERSELRSDLEFRRGLFKLQEQQLNEVREERDKFHGDADAFLDKMAKYQERAIDAERERDQYKGLLIRLYNDLFVHHKGEAVREFKELFREENYN
jgi:hypothetical protein